VTTEPIEPDDLQRKRDHRLFGVYAGVVLDNQDPLQRGRVLVRVPAVDGGKGQGQWAPVAVARVAADRAPKRVTSPPARSPSDEPSSREMADVTVIAVWRELQNTQNTSPENRHA